MKPILQAIAAKADDMPCCDWVGESGAGHYVKMVHNGIEYGDMQLISEVYQILRDGLGMSHDEMSQIFDQYNNGELNSFLVQITRDILKFKDTDGQPLVAKIRDAAGQKGTGKWTAVEALDMGIPVTLIGEAVLARSLSSFKDERVRASKVLIGPTKKFTGNKQELIAQLGAVGDTKHVISDSTDSHTEIDTFLFSFRPCTLQRSFHTPKDSCCYVRPQRHKIGI